MLTIELSCLVIVLTYVLVRARFADEPRELAAAYVWLAVAAAIGESSCIGLYDFYSYEPTWSVFVGPVPLMVVLIWPCVVISAWDISRHLNRHAWLVAGGLVLADASLIEPIAVRAGLWHWHEPGLFDVPVVGLLGWALFAGAGVWVLGRWRDPWRRAFLAPLSLVVVHAGVLASWWGGLRWLNQPWSENPAVFLLWVGSLALTVRLWVTRARDQVPGWIMWVRVLPAAFFFVLLALFVREPALWVWTLAFAPPYLSLTRWRSRP